jgi:hypothetical protein
LVDIFTFKEGKKQEFPHIQGDLTLQVPPRQLGRENVKVKDNDNNVNINN